MYRNCMQTRHCNCECDNNNDCMNNKPCNNNCGNQEMNCYQYACSNVPNYHHMMDDCACGFDEEDMRFPTNPMYGQSYVPVQTMDKTFIPCVGLKMGTIFPELVSPYMPGQSQREIDFIRNSNKIKEGCNG